MTLYRKKYRVETTRLAAWDYSSQGYYFVTLCSKEHQCYFGEIVAGEMVPSDLGRAAQDCWMVIPDHFPFATVDESVVMPNHVHGIVILRPDAGPSRSSGFGPQSRNLASIMRGYKIGVKKYAIEHGLPFDWQARFYEHIIRNEESLGKIREYIATNPARWDTDEYNTTCSVL